jgi:DNA-binding CsgD family transcriptional regulator
VIHFLLLFVILFGGRLWDLRPDKAVIVCSGMLIAALALSVAYNQGVMGQGLAYSLLERLRVLLLIACYAAAAKLFKQEATLALLIVAVYILMPIQSTGLILRGLAAHIPFGIEAFSTLIAVGIVACLWQFRRIVAAMPELWHVSQALPAVDGKFLSFSAAHELTAREMDTLRCLLNEDSREDIATCLGLSARTVRHHLANLERKVKMPNERSVIDYYRSWQLKI